MTLYDLRMAMAPAHRDAASAGGGPKRFLLGMGAPVIVLIVALVVAVLMLSGATLASDATALARVSVGPLGGTIERVQAFGPDGQPVPLTVSGGRLTPLKGLHPRERGSAGVTVRRPGWVG